MELIYGTTNPAKLESMRRYVQGLPLTILPPPYEVETDESGQSPLENARIKALAYFEALKRPVFAVDSGLYIDGLPEIEQPGTHVRRVGGKRLSDEEMIQYYTGIAKRMGGYAKARYRNGVCLVLADGSLCEYDGEDIATKWFYIATKPHPHRTEGFPLDSASVEIESLRYYNDLDPSRSKRLDTVEKGYHAFFAKALGLS